MKCYTCQESGHLARDCPNKKSIQEVGTTCRVYTLDAKKVKGSSYLIVGMSYMQEHLLFILFDYEATHVFIFTRCIERLRLEVLHLLSPMNITITNDDNV